MSKKKKTITNIIPISDKKELSEVDIILNSYPETEEKIEHLMNLISSLKKPLLFREIQKFITNIVLHVHYYNTIDHETTLMLWKVTAGNQAYTPEERMSLGVCFLNLRFSKIKTRKLFRMLMEIEPIEKEHKILYTTYLLQENHDTYPPWAYVTEEELDEALHDLNQNDETFKEIPSEHLEEVITKFALGRILSKYYQNYMMPTAVNQYAALWGCLLSDNPEEEIENIFQETKTLNSRSLYPIYKGLVEAVYRLQNKLDLEFVRKIFDRFLDLGNGEVRKNVYKFGFEIFGPSFVQSGLEEKNTAVKNFVMKLLKQDAPTNNNETKQGHFFEDI
ncbi:hypothetical protein KAU33_10430 [Candidatus Dependentiae bacterium]|nr:hypothetical protein [Candidatus Dependentiae bacterium]